MRNVYVCWITYCYLNLYVISYILLVAEYNECRMYMYDGLRPTVYKLY